MRFASAREPLDERVSQTDEETGRSAEVLSALRRSAALGENRSSSVPPAAEFSDAQTKVHRERLDQTETQVEAPRCGCARAAAKLCGVVRTSGAEKSREPLK
jgi:hypothetical protein